MRAGAGPAAWTAIAAALAMLAALAAPVAAPAAEGFDAAAVRVRSTPGVQPATQIVLSLRPDTSIEDRTPGARRATEGQGPASAGDTFTDEITLFLGGVRLARAASVEVGDDLVSAVRLFPEAAGATAVVFVRQPVSYTVARPSALGDVVLDLRARGRAAVAAPARRGTRLGSTATGEVSVDADALTYDQATDTLIARGGVSLTRGAVTLRADEVRYDRTNGVAEAQGNVVLLSPEGTITGDAGRFDVGEETGWVDEATSTFAASGYRLEAGRLEKGVGARYQVEDGVFTTCRCGGLEDPSWSIACKRADVHLGGLGIARGAQFRVKDVPVLWFPALPFPANTDRQTGFLMPRIGYSNRRGFQYEQPFYWAIDKSQDLTVATDVETAARLGILGEYRYAFSGNTRGAFIASYFNEAIGGSNRDSGTLAITASQADVPENRFGFFGRHDMRLGWGLRHYVDLFAVSDDQFLRDMNVFTSTVRGGVQLRSTRMTRSSTGVVKSWSGGWAQLDTTYYQDLISPQEFTPQRLPQVRAEHRVAVFEGLAVARLAGEGVSFQRETGFDGVRGDVFPELFVPFSLGRALNGSLTGRVRETAYYLTNTDQVGLFAPANVTDPQTGEAVAGGAPYAARPIGLPKLDRTHSRELAEVRGLLGTEVARVYDFPHFGFTRLRHSVSPELRWLYVPPLDDQQTQTSVCGYQLYRGRPDRPRGLVAIGDPTVRSCADPPVAPGAGLFYGQQRGTFLGRGYLFDEVDAINRRNFLAWGLSTRVLGRGGTPLPQLVDDEDEDDDDGGDDGEGAVDDPEAGPEAPPGAVPAALEPAGELLRVGVLHGYDFNRALQPDGRQLSDVDLGLRLTPTAFLGIAYDATWSLDRSSIIAHVLGGVLREPWWAPSPERRFQSPTTLAVSYSQVREQTGGIGDLPLSAGFTRQATQDVSGSVYLRLGDYLGFHFIARYDLDGGMYQDPDDATQLRTYAPGFLERDYIVRLISPCNCWALEAGLADKSNPDERLFRIQLTLLGLGSFGQGTARNFSGFTGLQTLGYRQPTPLRGTHW